MNVFSELKRRNVFRVGIAYTVAAWLLIQVADTVFPRIGLPDSAVTLVIALLAIGFIPALIFAWAFEMTPEGLKREKDVDRTQSMTGQTGQKLNRMIIAGLLLVIIVLALFLKPNFPEYLRRGSQLPRLLAEGLWDFARNPRARGVMESLSGLTRAIPTAGSASSSNVRSGRRVPWTCRSSHATGALPMPRAAPW